MRYCDNPYYLPYSVEENGTTFFHIPKAIEDYCDLVELIGGERNIEKRLEYCHRQLELLPFWVQNELKTGDFLPPEIPCRDWRPGIYMYKGDWASAESFIRKCIEANAYYPNHGEKELAELAEYQKVSEITVTFLQQHPGFLQKDIYKALADKVADISLLKHFVRWSLQIRKEPYGKTNRLFIAEKKRDFL